MQNEGERVRWLRAWQSALDGQRLVNYRRGRASVAQGWTLGARGQLPD